MAIHGLKGQLYGGGGKVKGPELGPESSLIAFNPN